MNSNVIAKCDLLEENYKNISKGFRLENNLLQATVAASYATQAKSVDIEYLKECREILRKKQFFFSNLRGNRELLVACKMALSGNPEKYLEELIEVYDKFEKGTFFTSQYRVLAALSLCDAGKYSEADEIIEKTFAILKIMQKEHPFIANEEDTGLVCILAMTDKSVDQVIEELESTYKSIKKNFKFHDNAAYSLSQVLTSYEGDVDSKCERIMEIYNAFSDAGEKYGKEYELASLGILIRLNRNVEDLVAEIKETSDYLKNAKGFGGWSMSRATRLMFATLMVQSIYSDDNVNSNASVIGSTVAMIIAQEVAFMLIAISASTAATSAAD